MTTQVRDVNPETRRASRLLPLSSLPMELLAAPFNIGQEMATYAVHPHALILAQHEAVRKTLVSGTMANNNCCWSFMVRPISIASSGPEGPTAYLP
jgi:hypothetical protein